MDRCPLCGVDLATAEDHWGHGSSPCPVRVFATREELERMASLWGIREVIVPTKHSPPPIIVDRAMSLYYGLGNDELKQHLKKILDPNMWRIAPIERV